MMLRVPLIRVEGKHFTVRPDLTLTPERFARAEPLRREARDQTARDAEAAFDFESSLYFFAGIAHPSFGDIVLAYHPETSTKLSGSMTTFDSGGMYLGHIRGRGLSTSDERKAYVAHDCCLLEDWRARASAWIAKNFGSIDNYIDPNGRPCCDDLEDRLGHPENERRAWAIEVRVYDDRELFSDVAFIVVRQEFLQRALHTASVPDRIRLLQLLEEETIISIDLPEMHPCDSAVEHIKTYVDTIRSVAS